MFNFVSPHPGHVVCDPSGATLATFTPGPGRRPTQGFFSTTDLHLAVRLDTVAAKHGVKRALMAERDVVALERAKAAAQEGALKLAALPAPKPAPAPEAPAPADEAPAQPDSDQPATEQPKADADTGRKRGK